MSDILPVEVWYEIKKYFSDHTRAQNVSKDFRQIFIDEHHIDRKQHFENFKNLFVPECEVSPLVDKLLSELKNRIDSDHFLHYCDLILQNRNEILVTFKLLHPTIPNYDNYQYIPPFDFFERTIFMLTKVDTSYQDCLLMVYDQNKFSQSWFKNKIGKNYCETINFATRKLSNVLKYKSSFSKLSNNHFFPQTDDVLINVFHFWKIKQIKTSKFIYLPETDKSVEKLYQYQHLIEHPVDVVFSISPFDWDTFVDLKQQLFQIFSNVNVICSFLLCHHLVNFLDLNIRWNKNAVLPYQVLNLHSWKRIQCNINTLMEYDSNCFKLNAQYSYHLLTLHPKNLRSRCNFITKSLLRSKFNLTKQLILMNLSVAKLSLIEKDPTILCSSKNVPMFYYYVQKLNEAELWVLNELLYRSLTSKSSYLRSTLNFLYFSHLFEQSDFIDRLMLMKRNCLWFTIQRNDPEFYRAKTLDDYRIIFDKEKFAACKDVKLKMEFVESQRNKVLLNWHELMDASFCYVPDDIMLEYMKFVKYLPEGNKFQHLLLTSILSRFTDDEFIIGWNILKTVSPDLFSMIACEVHSLSDLYHLSENLQNGELIEFQKNKSHLLVKKNLSDVMIFIRTNFDSQIAPDLSDFDMEQLRSLKDYRFHLKDFPYLSYLKNQHPDEIRRVFETFAHNEIT
jgi:hypothetical protein